MKKALRIVALLMAALMMFGSLVACNNTTTDPTETETSQATSTGVADNFPENLKGVKFEGEQIGIIVSGGSYATRSIYVDTEADDYDPDYSVNVAVDKRNKLVEDYLGVTINPEETIGMQGMVEYMRNHFTAPTVDLDIVGVYQYFDLGLAFGENIGSFLNYNDITEDGENYINVDAPYWDKGTYDTLSWEESSFWLTGDLSQMWISSPFVAFVNANMWKDYAAQIKELTGYEDIYELVYAGKWTLDLILELNEIVHINNDGNESTVSLQDQHGFLTYTAKTGINSIVVDALFSGANITWTKYNSETGYPEISFYSQKLIDYADKVHKLYNQSKSCLIDYNGETGDQVVNRFSEGNTLVTLNILSDAEMYLGDMEDDYYIIPLPKLSESQKKYTTTLGDGVTQFGIPSTCDNVAAATATLELLGYYSYEEVTPVYYEEVLKGRYVRGDASEAAKMIDYIRTTIYSDFALIWANSISNYGGGESLSWYMRNQVGQKNLALNARAKEKVWQNALDDLLTELEVAGVIEM